MRTRIRTVKPDFYSDEKVCSISVPARFTLVGMLNIADDRGRLRLSSSAVAGFVFPDGSASPRQVAGFLDEIISAQLLWRYEIRGNLYGWFRKFWAHQVISKPAESELPAHPLDPYMDFEIREAIELFRNVHGRRRDDSRNIPGTFPSSRARARVPVPIPSSSSVEEIEGKEEKDDARELFDFWRDQCNHPSAKATPERMGRIRDRLKQGYTVEQIREAIIGAAKGAHVNASGKRFDDIELICRTGSKLESFIDRATASPNVVPISGKQPNAGQLIAKLRLAEDAS